MFLVYWPILALVVSLVLLSIFLVLVLSGRVCRARLTTLPDRPLGTYLPDQVSSTEICPVYKTINSL